MGIIKTPRTLIASGPNASGAITEGSGLNLSATYGGLATLKVTNGATEPSTPCAARLEVSHDGSAWKTFFQAAALQGASVATEWVVDVPPAAMHLRAAFSGNTGQSVTVEASFLELTALDAISINEVSPSLASTGLIGSSITGTRGFWTGSPTLTHQFQAYDPANELWSPIPGETSLDLDAIPEEYDGTQIRLMEIPDGDESRAAYSDPIDITYAAPEITNVGTVSGSPVVGAYLSHSGLVVTGSNWYPTVVWLSNGSPIPGAPTGSTFGPISSALAGTAITSSVTATNSGGSDTEVISVGTVAYQAPTPVSLSSLTLTEGVAADSIDVRSMFAVPGDPSLASCTIAVVSGGVAGMSLSGYIYSGTPDRPRAAANIVFSATNSGGTVNSSRSITVAERPLGAELSFNQTFDDNTAANWTVANSASAAVSGGVLTLTAGAANAQLRRTAFDPGFSGVGRLKVPASFALSSGTGYLDFRVGTSAGGNQYAGLRYNQSTGTVQSTINGGSTFQTAKQDAAGNYYVDNTTTQFVSGTNIFVSLVIQNSGAVGVIDWVRIRPHGTASAVPDQVTSLVVTSADAVTGDMASVSVTGAPADGGLAITAYEYDFNDGVPRAFEPPLTATGARAVKCPAPETATSMRIRAVNANGPGPWSTAQSTTPHFSPSCRFVADGGSDSAAGTWAAPWATPSKMGLALTAGQIGYIRPHTYAGTTAPIEIANSGTSANPITITTLPGEEWLAVIDGTGLSNQRGLVEIRARDWVVVKNLRLQNAPTDGVYVESTSGSQHGHHRIRGLQIDTTGNSGVYVCGLVMGQTIPVDTYRTIDIEISDCDITNTNWDSGGNECITVGGGVDGVLVEGNYIHDSRQYAMDFKMGVRNGIMRRNLARRVLKHGFYLDAACRALVNVQVYDNWFEECGQNLGNGGVLAREADRGATQGHNETIYNVAIWNNFFIKSGNFGILVSRHVNDTVATGEFKADIFHNTVWSAGYVQSAGVEFKIDNLLGTVLVRATNNVFAGPAGTTFTNAYSGSGTFTDANNIKTNSPGFANAAGLDFSLAGGSPALNAGSAAYRGYTPVVVTINGVAYTPDYDKDYGGYLPSLGEWAPYRSSIYRTPVTRATTPDCGALEAA